MLEPLGQSQVLAYLKRLAQNRCIHLISFEKQKDCLNQNEIELFADEIAASGIFWHPLRYHKSPTALATSIDIIFGIALSLWLVIRYRIKIIHARSYVPSVIALLLKKITGVKFIFDMRGFWADEKVDGGEWDKNGLLYHVTKKFERLFMLNADHIVSLTNAGIREIKLLPYMAGYIPPFSIIPTCADLRHFCPSPNINLNISKRHFVLGYVGSVGTYYMFEEVLACFVQLLKIKPDARLLIVNRGQHDFILNQ